MAAWLLALLTAAAAGSCCGSSCGAVSSGAAGARHAPGGLAVRVFAVLLLMLWQPALSVATLRSQQNVVAVVLDASLSMALERTAARVWT
jgi:hypothetical protein